MSENLRAPQWDADASFEQHAEAFRDFMTILKSGLVLPGDQRHAIASAMLTMGGQENAVDIVGNPGTGKTVFGDIIYGIENRVEIDPQAVKETLYGYESPVTHTYLKADLKGLRPEAPVGPTAYLNERSQLKNTAPLHPLYDAQGIEVSGVWVPLRDVSILSTSNFVDGTPRVHPRDAALGSRMAAEILSGDNTKETANEINSRSRRAVEHILDTYSPLLPPADVRSKLREKVADHYSQGPEAENGAFLTDLIDRLNKTDLLEPMDISDARKKDHLHNAARAALFVDYALSEGKDRQRIMPRHLARVAALVLPTLTEVSFTSRTRMQAEAGRRPSELEKKVLLRRVIAQAAISVVLDSRIVTSADRDRMTRQFVDQYSYANARAHGVQIDINRVLNGSEATASKNGAASNGNGNHNGSRKSFTRLRSLRRG